MKSTTLTRILSVACLAGLSLMTGCKNHHSKQFHTRTQPLGTASDPIWQQQEENAEASDFVIHEHEFRDDTVRLNRAGEEHLKQIAARATETHFPILIQPSSMSAREDDVHGFPVHENDELDLRRRELVVRALLAMGVHDAEERVVVAPAYVPGFMDFEAEQAYGRGFGNWNSGGMSGFGGFSSFRR